MTDNLRDYRDIALEISEVAKLEIFTQLQTQIDELGTLDVSVCYATRDTSLVGKDWPDKQPLQARLIYLSASTRGNTLTKMAVPKKIEFAF